MAAKNYGTIAIIPAGEWDNTKQYKVGRVVSYNGSSYLVHTLPPVGTLPTNTEYYQLSAQGGGIATEDSPGVVKPDNISIDINNVGTISVKKATDTEFGIITSGNGTKINTEGKIDLDTNFEQAVNLANIIANEAFSNILGKISKSIAVTMGLDENALLKSMLTNQMENSTNKIPTAALVYALNQTVVNLNSNLTDFRDQYRKAISLPDDTDINTLISPGTYNVYTTIDSKKYRWIVVVDWCDASSVSLSRQTAYYYLGSGPMAPITRYQYNTGSGYAWSQWYYMDYHARINLTTGYISGMVNDKISQGYKGGDIALGSYAPPDTYNGNQYGIIKWTLVTSDIAYLQFLAPRSSAIITRAISASESYDSGWIAH